MKRRTVLGTLIAIGSVARLQANAELIFKEAQ